MELNIGTTVLFKNERGEGWTHDGSMDMYKGAVATITFMNISGSFNVKRRLDDPVGGWSFGVEDIECVLSQPFKVGDIVASKWEVKGVCSDHYKASPSAEPILDRFTKYYEQTNVVDLPLLNEKMSSCLRQRLTFIGKIISIDTDRDICLVKILKHRYTESGEIVTTRPALLMHIYNKYKEKGENNNMKPQYYQTATIDLQLITSYPNQVEKEIIPAISSYKVYNDKAMITTFTDGTTTKVVCADGDTFDEELGLEKCILKKLCGEHFKNQIQKIIKDQHRKEEEARKQKELEEEEKKRKEEKRLKNETRKFDRKIKKQAKFEVALVLEKEKILKKLSLSEKQKKILNESFSVKGE